MLGKVEGVSGALRVFLKGLDDVEILEELELPGNKKVLVFIKSDLDDKVSVRVALQHLREKDRNILCRDVQNRQLVATHERSPRSRRVLGTDQKRRSHLVVVCLVEEEKEKKEKTFRFFFLLCSLAVDDESR